MWQAVQAVSTRWDHSTRSRDPCTTTTKSRTSSAFNHFLNLFVIQAEEKSSQDLAAKRPEKVLVGGGSGFVGRELTAQLRRRGYEVILVSRRRGEHTLSWEDIEQQGLPEKTKAVINLAGQNVLDPFRRWSLEFKELCRSSRIETTKLLASAASASASGPEVFVSVSGVGYYAPDGKTVYDESGSKGSDWLADLASDWEAASSGCGLGVRRVNLRPGVVLGRDGGMIQQIFLPFYLGLGGRMGEGSQPMAWIHVKDLAGLIVHAVETDTMEGVYNAVAPQLVTNQEFVGSFAGALNRPAFFPLPEFVWNFVFGPERAVMITQGQKVVPSRTLASGYSFRFPSITQACAEFARFPYSDPDRMKKEA